MIAGSPSGQKRPQDQTHEEWLSGYNENGSYPGEQEKFEADKGSQQSVVKLNTEHIRPTHGHTFKFHCFRTTRKNSVALDFISADGSVKATAFFGVKLQSNRGTNYRTGAGGQFIPSRRGKFFEFWMEAVGEEPSRPSIYHKSMRSKLKDKLFSGDISKAKDGKGEAYFKLTNLRLFEQAQTGHK